MKETKFQVTYTLDHVVVIKQVIFAFTKAEAAKKFFSQDYISLINNCFQSGNVEIRKVK